VEQLNQISLEVLGASWLQLFRLVRIEFFLLLYFGLHRQNLKDLQLFVMIPLVLEAHHLRLQPGQIMPNHHHFLRIELPKLFMVFLHHCFHPVSFLFILQLVLDSISLHALQVSFLFFLICVEF